MKFVTKKHITSVYNGHYNQKCNSCEKSFLQAGDLKKHINAVQNGQKDYKCGSCGKSFSQAGNLKKHINAVHNGQNSLSYILTYHLMHDSALSI